MCICEQTWIEMLRNQLCFTQHSLLCALSHLTHPMSADRLPHVWCWGHRSEGAIPYVPVRHSWPSVDVDRQTDRQTGDGVVSASRKQHRKGTVSLCVAGEGTQEVLAQGQI